MSSNVLPLVDTNFDAKYNDQDLYRLFVTNNLPKVIVGGLAAIALTRKEWASLFISIAKNRLLGDNPPPYFSSLNGEVISRCYRDSRIRLQFEQSDGLAVDGMPAVFASRWFTASPIPERTATTDLFHDVAVLAQENGITMYFLGAKAQVNMLAVKSVLNIYPGLRIVGHRNGYFNEAESYAVAKEIDQLKPGIVWISMGVPREQQFCLKFRDSLKNVGLLKTSGGLLDFLSGVRSRAPAWMQQTGLEWAYRLGLEPRRLFIRYAATNLDAAWLLATKTRSIPISNLKSPI